MPDDFYTAWVELYDLMIDWPRRLAREGPALLELLGRPEPRPVLEVACGTGRHLRWLADAGVSIVGTDVSAEMLAVAGRNVPDVLLTQWSMSEPVPAELTSRGPFTGLLCLGNSFPHVVEDDAVARTLANFGKLLAPGGKLVIGLKALAVLKDAGRPFLPLVRRKLPDQASGADADPRAAADVLFVRFYEFVAGPPAAADFHMVIVGHGVPLLGPAGVHHAVTRLRAWHPDELGEAVRAAGFRDVVVASDLAGRPWRPGDGEDVFVLAESV